jgi:hypothetical protein
MQSRAVAQARYRARPLTPEHLAGVECGVQLWMAQSAAEDTGSCYSWGMVRAHSRSVILAGAAAFVEVPRVVSTGLPEGNMDWLSER